MRERKRAIRYDYLVEDNLGVHTIHDGVGDRKRLKKIERKKNEQEKGKEKRN